MLSKLGSQLRSLTIGNMRQFDPGCMDMLPRICPKLEKLSVPVDYLSELVFTTSEASISSPQHMEPLPLVFLELTGLGESVYTEDYLGLSALDICSAIDEGNLPHLRTVRMARSLGWHVGTEAAEELEDLIARLDEKAAIDCKQEASSESVHTGTAKKERPKAGYDYHTTKHLVWSRGKNLSSFSLSRDTPGLGLAVWLAGGDCVPALGGGRQRSTTMRNLSNALADPSLPVDSARDKLTTALHGKSQALTRALAVAESAIDVVATHESNRRAAMLEHLQQATSMTLAVADTVAMLKHYVFAHDTATTITNVVGAIARSLDQDGLPQLAREVLERLW
ncbi:hypothetical protein B0A49_10914 [Cryomyces minteri]|uniref:Uncharacterized protein n=1 Tax=Cryomyces minteri TaxID=331657 RepID=A0A4V5NCJ7_9PEZI|nr:hypothetical protein B0A49_10914 [Cryomyces minteri]